MENNLNIPELIKEAHKNAVDKGFYDCPECEGQGFFDIFGDPGLDIENQCPKCKGTRKDPNKNIGELLMLIVSELGEALEAHRKGKFADWGRFERIAENRISYFKSDIKDTFEDEIADVFIRLFDLCGYLEIQLNQFDHKKHKTKFHSTGNLGDDLYRLTQIISKMRFYENEEMREYFIFHLYSHLKKFCFRWDLDIEKHISAKMAYNKTRPHKHGKDY